MLHVLVQNGDHKTWTTEYYIEKIESYYYILAPKPYGEKPLTLGQYSSFEAAKEILEEMFEAERDEEFYKMPIFF